jgi:hypothetical protein
LIAWLEIALLGQPNHNEGGNQIYMQKITYEDLNFSQIGKSLNQFWLEKYNSCPAKNRKSSHTAFNVVQPRRKTARYTTFSYFSYC